MTARQPNVSASSADCQAAIVLLTKLRARFDRFGMEKIPAYPKHLETQMALMAEVDAFIAAHQQPPRPHPSEPLDRIGA